MSYINAIVRRQQIADLNRDRLKSGKAKTSRETGGWVIWTAEDMAKYRARWLLGTGARLMFEILHYTFLRLGDAHRFGPPYLRQVVRKMAVQIATEKSHGNTAVTVPVHPGFAESLRTARAAGIIGGEVFEINASLTILGAKDEEDAIRIADDTPYGLAGYVFGDSLDSARRVSRRIRAGTINLQGSPLERTAPFGGYKRSGNGREWGKFGLEEFLEVKAIASFNAA